MTNEKEWSLSAVLGTGRASAIHIETLARMFDTTTRKIYKQIARERKEGAPIVPNGQRGYYLADPDTEEGREVIEQTRRRLEALGRNTVTVAGAMGRG